MRLHLIRHGQSRNNAVFAETVGPRGVGYPGRVPDPELTTLGHRQADALAEAVGSGRIPLPLTHLYSSLTVRAVQTAAPLADALALPVVLRDDAYEVGGVHRHDLETDTRHAVQGRSPRDLVAMCPRAVASRSADPDLPWHGGFETVDDALPRARRLLADLCAAHAGTDDVVGLVSHQYFGQFVLAAVLGLDGPPWRRFRIDNTAQVAIEFSGAHPQIAWTNRCDHLAPCDVTN